MYLLKPKNLALTQSLTCLPVDFLLIFLVFYATISAIGVFVKLQQQLKILIFAHRFFKCIKLQIKYSLLGDICPHLTMDYIKPIIQQNIQSTISSFFEGGAIILNHILQTIFFVYSFTSIISTILLQTNFFFAQYIGNSMIVRLIAFSAFFYFEFWQGWFIGFEIIGYLCAMNISRYLYEGSRDFGFKICSKKANSNYAVLFTAVFIISSWALLYLNKYQQQPTMQYPYLGLYCALAITLLVLGTIKNIDIIYTIICLSGIALIILTRHFCQTKLEKYWLKQVYLPVQALVYIPCALQSEVNQKQNPGQKSWPSKFFQAQVYYFIFFLLNKRCFPIQIAFGGYCLICYLKGKKKV